jgi:N-glycosyltransferase
MLTPELIADKLGTLRASYGLPADGDPYPYLLASFTFPGYCPELDAIGTIRHYRQPQAARRGERVPDWLAGTGDAAWPPAGKPLVFAAFGSVLPGVSWKTGPIIAAVLRALNDLDCAAVLAAGPTAADLIGEAGPLVRVVETAPQPLLIEAADLFITHAGFGSVREALRAGTPMLAIPIIGDQPYHAARCADLGTARSLRTTASPAAIGRACAEMLAPGAGYQAAARRVQRECLTLPPVDDLVEDLVALTRSAVLGTIRDDPSPGNCCCPGLVVYS